MAVNADRPDQAIGPSDRCHVHEGVAWSRWSPLDRRHISSDQRDVPLAVSATGASANSYLGLSAALPAAVAERPPQGSVPEHPCLARGYGCPASRRACGGVGTFCTFAAVEKDSWPPERTHTHPGAGR